MNLENIHTLSVSAVKMRSDLVALEKKCRNSKYQKDLRILRTIADSWFNDILLPFFRNTSFSDISRDQAAFEAQFYQIWRRLTELLVFIREFKQRCKPSRKRH